MKILFLNDYSTPGGGAEILTLTLRDGLRKKGHDARLFSSTAATCAGEPLADYECYGTMSRFRTLSQTANVSAYLKLQSVLKEFQPDVVHVHMFMTQLSPLILPLLREIPALYHVNLYEAICPLATKYLPHGEVCHARAGRVCHESGCIPLRAVPPQLLRMKMFRRWISSFDLFIAASEIIKKFLKEESIEPVEVIPNGVPVTVRRPPLQDPPTISFAGHLIPRKGADTLVTAFATVVSKLPEARLLIAGQGPEEKKLRQSAERLGISKNVEMLGFLGKQEMEQRFSSAWVHATPSIWEEPFGITSLEAMMRGTAVVASRVGGQLDCVREGENGILVPPNHPEQLAAALLRILQDRPLAEKMGEKGRAIALHQFSESKYVERFEDVYMRLVQHPLGAKKRASSKDGIAKAINILKSVRSDFLETLGYQLVDSHYYNPVPNLTELRELPPEWWTNASDLPGIDLREEEQVARLDTFLQLKDEYNRIPNQAAEVPYRFHLINGKFDGTDALILYCMIRQLKPRRVIEVGGGFSTYLTAEALLANGHGDLITIEPFPNDTLQQGFPGLTQLIKQKVQHVDPDLFSQLDEGDILFIDSTHTVKTGSDVNHLILEVLPRLKKGVYIHFHDIFLPQEYPRTWILEHRLFWTEMYLLRAFLMFNSAYRVIFANNFMGLKHMEKMRAAFPTSPWHGGGSFWIQKMV